MVPTRLIPAQLTSPPPAPGRRKVKTTASFVSCTPSFAPALLLFVPLRDLTAVPEGKTQEVGESLGASETKELWPQGRGRN